MVTLQRIASGGLIILLCGFCAACGGGNNGEQGAPLIPTPVTSPKTFFGCTAPAASTSPAGSLSAIVDSAVATEIKAAGLPGMTVAIAKNGVLLYSQAYGYANTSSCTPVQLNTEYQIGSLTKQFTATAILQLQNSGKLNIDNTVISYLPSYPFDARITLRMLLNHTAGLDDYVDNPVQFPPPPGWERGVTQQYILTKIAAAPLLFTPGSAYLYSNSGYFILGSIIEAVSGKTYSDYVATQIFQASGLAHTSYLQPLTSAAPYSYANPLVPNTQGLAQGIIPDPSVYFSAGALWSSAQDLVAWDAALGSGNILPPALLDQMVTPAAVPVFQHVGTQSSYAMGWVRGTMSGHPMVFHGGQTLAYTSFNGVFLDDGFSVAILTNVDIQESNPLLAFAQQLIQSICSSPSTASAC